MADELRTAVEMFFKQNGRFTVCRRRRKISATIYAWLNLEIMLRNNVSSIIIFFLNLCSIFSMIFQDTRT